MTAVTAMTVLPETSIATGLLRTEAPALREQFPRASVR